MGSVKQLICCKYLKFVSQNLRKKLIWNSLHEVKSVKKQKPMISKDINVICTHKLAESLSVVNFSIHCAQVGDYDSQ